MITPPQISVPNCRVVTVRDVDTGRCRCTVLTDVGHWVMCGALEWCSQGHHLLWRALQAHGPDYMRDHLVPRRFPPDSITRHMSCEDARDRGEPRKVYARVMVASGNASSKPLLCGALAS